MPNAIAIIFAPNGQAQPPALRQWLEAQQLPVRTVASDDELMELALRSRPRVAYIDARTHPVAALKACQRLKSDSYTGVVPCVLSCRDDDTSFAAAFDAGADEVLRDGITDEEMSLRLTALLRRSDRDTFVHPSTRLPGANEIERVITTRMKGATPFAACYADLDHFKEFNDRYSWYDGDRVIRILSKILHDVVKGTCGEAGFVGHIGGDDFLFIVPTPVVAECCSEIIACFDTLVPFQYSEQDRRAGYFFGKDRRGQLHKVPLMTVSIGVVTNERRRFTDAAEVSELATEMKSYAKTLTGSVYTVDRRTDLPASGSRTPRPGPTVAGAREET